MFETSKTGLKFARPVASSNKKVCLTQQPNGTIIRTAKMGQEKIRAGLMVDSTNISKILGLGLTFRRASSTELIISWQAQKILPLTKVFKKSKIGELDSKLLQMWSKKQNQYFLKLLSKKVTKDRVLIPPLQQFYS